MTFVVAIGMVVTTISMPMTKTALKTYHLNAAVSAVTGAIQSTRYQAIMHGYHYNITLNPATQTYQVGSKVPPATAFSNVGTAIPWCPTGDVTMSPSTTIEFFSRWDGYSNDWRDELYDRQWNNDEDDYGFGSGQCHRHAIKNSPPKDSR